MLRGMWLGEMWLLAILFCYAVLESLVQLAARFSIEVAKGKQF